MSDFRTLAQWNAAGYALPKGQTATHYLLSPDSLTRVAVWSSEQVVKLTDDWTLVAKEDLPPAPGADLKGKRVRYSYENGKMMVWCGSHKVITDLLRKGGYRFKPSIGRWHKDASKAQQEAFVKAAEKRGFIVIDENETL